MRPSEGRGDMRRRDFIVAIAGLPVPSVAFAQPANKPVIGFMHPGTARANAHLVRAFESGLSDAGFLPDKNITIEYRWADDNYDRLPSIADELVAKRVSVLAVGTPIAVIAAKRATSSIPIVFSMGGDPLRGGLVASLSHPGGNVTGATFFSNVLTAKRFALLSELVPNAKVFGALVNPKNANAKMQTGEAEDAARSLSKRLVVVQAVGESEFESAFGQLKNTGVEALIVLSDAVLNAHARQIAKLALSQSLPTCFAYREPVDVGGLISYGAHNRTDTMRQAAVYAGRILKGEKPADLPVQQPSKFELVINMKTAKALNLTIPNSMQLLADEVIE